MQAIKVARIFLLFLALLTVINTSHAQTKNPGGVSQNLNIWINSQPENLIKSPQSTGSSIDYVFDWKFLNDPYKTYIAPFLSQAPLFYNNDQNHFINEYEAVSFDPSIANHSMISSNVALRIDTTTEVYIFCVPTLNATSHTGRNPISSTPVLPSSTNHLELDIADSYGRIGWYHGNAQDTFFAPMPSIELKKPYLWSFRLQVDSLQESIAQNGRVFAQKSNPNPIHISQNLYSYLGFSAINSSNQNYGKFDLGEFVLFQGHLSTDEVHQVESYLAYKYGLALKNTNNSNKSLLSSSGSFMWNAALAASYSHHPAGVGVDKASGLYQKQNHHAYSADKGDMLRLGLESISATNSSNLFSFGSHDLIFYSWSDNNDSVASIQKNDIPIKLFDSACVSRIPREWMMQVHSSDTSYNPRTYVQFDLNNTIDLSGKSLHNIRLMIDEDGNGDFTDGNYRLIAPTSFSNNIVRFDSVKWDLDHNGRDVFTIIYDLNKVKPKIYTRDTVYGIPGESLSIYEGFQQMDTLAFVYYFYDENLDLVDSTAQTRLSITDNKIYYYTVRDKNAECESSFQKVQFVFRPILRTFKKVTDQDHTGTVLPDEELTYQIYVINVDDVTHRRIDSIHITDTIPQHTSYLNGSISAPGIYNSGIVYFDYSGAGLEYGDTLVLVPTFQVVADSVLDSVEEISNTAWVDFTDPSSQKNYRLRAGCDTMDASSDCDASGSTLISTTARYADLSIMKEKISTESVAVDKEIIYRLTARNAGPYTAPKVKIIDSLPPNLEFISLSLLDSSAQYDPINHIVLWNLDSLDTLDTPTLDITCLIKGGPSILNIATISSIRKDSALADNRVELFTAFSDNPIDVGDIPNVITPNGDNKNDVFDVPGLEHFPGSSLSIFDRWGSQVYRSADYKNDWSGSGLGEGTYFYVLIVNNPAPQQVIKSYIQIIQ